MNPVSNNDLLSQHAAPSGGKGFTTAGEALPIIHRGYQFRLYPTKEQRVMLAKAFGCCRFLYNHFLAERNSFYEANKDSNVKKGLSYYDTQRMLTELKKKEDTKWLADAPSQMLQQPLRHLDNAFSRFFKKEAKFPSAKKKSNDQSCTFPQKFYLDKEKQIVRLSKLGSLRLVMSREIPAEADIRSVTVSKTASGEYYVSFLVIEKVVPLPTVERVVGIDLGLIDVITTSDGKKYKNTHLKRQAAKRQLPP